MMPLPLDSVGTDFIAICGGCRTVHNLQEGLEEPHAFEKQLQQGILQPTSNARKSCQHARTKTIHMHSMFFSTMYLQGDKHGDRCILRSADAWANLC